MTREELEKKLDLLNEDLKNPIDREILDRRLQEMHHMLHDCERLTLITLLSEATVRCPLMTVAFYILLGYDLGYQKAVDQALEEL